MTEYGFPLVEKLLIPVHIELKRQEYVEFFLGFGRGMSMQERRRWRRRQRRRNPVGGQA